MSDAPVLGVPQILEGIAYTHDSLLNGMDGIQPFYAEVTI
ncbi:hypothetical protein SAMN05421687_1142 [Salimicrobium flavidum]|uniref:Uncharacterized protein n=1 Tax=Salimicrobium flavidum TaxID=570947 RepID=A0A1N7KM44_9BACI|nr:hypothetical protein SAMN05421687_1142 [Salimicrobium flavidum]